jgi:prolipoprotein diacylglyceryltransferase
MLYTAGRGWIESLRIDDAHKFLGLRLNDWTSVVLFAAAAAYFVIAGRKVDDRSANDVEVGRTLAP